MGNKVSAVTGVRSSNFFEPGNAVNEIWVGDLEVVSRLPFGDSDMAQAAWPKNDYPKIPWRPFIIPLRALFSTALKPRSLSAMASPEFGWLASLRTFADTKMLLVCWVVMQIFAIPLLMVPIALHLAPRDISSCIDDDDDDVVVVVDDTSSSLPIRPVGRDTRSLDDSPRNRRETTYVRALLGSVFLVSGVLVAYGFDHRLVMDSLRPSEPSSDPSEFGAFTPDDPDGLDAFAVYAAVSMALILNSAYSVFRLWWKFFRSNHDPENGEQYMGKMDLAIFPPPPDYTDEQVISLLL
ncbi:hypothetical protein GX48_03734 [Paracoccidioides brasiliensis]|nr:hypothetical protein GX48_03734 [Paracoccidioides brasiliensis]